MTCSEASFQLGKGDSMGQPDRLPRAIDSLHSIETALLNSERLATLTAHHNSPWHFQSIAIYQRLLQCKRARVARLMLAAI